MRYGKILNHLESAQSGIEELPEARTDSEAFLRIELAEVTAQAVNIARVLDTDEKETK